MSLSREPPEDDSGADWGADHVLLAIMIVFVLLLGYLQWASISRADALEKDLQDQGVLTTWVNGDDNIKDLVDEMTQAKKMGQQLRLRNAWLKLREEQPLYRRLKLAGDGGEIDLSPPTLGKDPMPLGTLYEGLRAEADRVFRGQEADGAPPEEVERLLRECCRRADFGKGEERLAPAVRRALAREVSFDPEIPSQENLDVVVTEIESDLLAQRRQVAAIQEALARRTIQSLKQNLLTQGLAETGEGANGGEQPEQAMRRLLDRLDNSLGLLPEVRRKLSGGS